MTTGLTPFRYHGHQVRTVQIDGEPWLIAEGGHTPTQRYAPHFKVTCSTYPTPDGSEPASYTTRVLPGSLEWIARRYGTPRAALIPGGVA